MLDKRWSILFAYVETSYPGMLIKVVKGMCSGTFNSSLLPFSHWKNVPNVQVFQGKFLDYLDVENLPHEQIYISFVSCSIFLIS